MYIVTKQKNPSASFVVVVWEHRMSTTQRNLKQLSRWNILRRHTAISPLRSYTERKIPNQKLSHCLKFVAFSTSTCDFYEDNKNIKKQFIR